MQNTLQRSAPLILTALAVAMPARIGLVMIGGEGALVLGGFASAAIAIPLVAGASAAGSRRWLVMAVAGARSARVWVGIVGFLRHARGVNETISSLLLTYIGIAIMNFFVEGSLRDLTNPNKPSTMPIGDAYMVGKIPGTDVHWGLAVGIVLAIVLHVLLVAHDLRLCGARQRRQCARRAGAGAAGRQADRHLLHDRRRLRRPRRASSRSRRSRAAPMPRSSPATASPASWSPFLARHNPLAIIPVAIMFGGIVASGGLIQRRMDLPDATVLVLQGLTFVVLLVSETLYGRFKIFQVQGRRIAHEREPAHRVWSPSSAARCASRRRSCSSRSASA